MDSTSSRALVCIPKPFEHRARTLAGTAREDAVNWQRRPCFAFRQILASVGTSVRDNISREHATNSLAIEQRGMRATH